MNVNLTKTWHVPVIVVSERYDHPRVISYMVTVSMTSTSMHSAYTNTAYERMRHWMTSIMRDAVIIDKNHPDLETWQTTGARCMVFPDDPVDQLVGIMLCCKLNAMCQGHLEVSSVVISSELDEDISYYHAQEDDEGPFSDSGWWNDSRPNWDSIVKRRKKNTNVINLRREPEWKDLELDWPSDPEDSTDTNKITEFSRDTDQ